jgi:hypothetical protein
LQRKAALQCSRRRALTLTPGARFLAIKMKEVRKRRVFANSEKNACAAHADFAVVRRAPVEWI